MNENTPLMTIHFFRNNMNPELDYQKLVDYFDDKDHFTTYYSDDCVEFEYKDDEFDLNYCYMITKKSHITQMYRLNPNFISAKLMLQFPLIIPSFLAREILTFTQKLCKTFELGCYTDRFEDVQNCNIVELMDVYEKEKAEYLEQNGLGDKIYYNNDKMGVICKFQRSIKELEEYYHNEVIVNKCYAIVQKDETPEDTISGICYDWKLGTPIIFPPYVDFINVITDDENYLVLKKDLIELINKKLLEIKNFLPDTYIVKAKQAKGCKKYLKKIMKIDQNINYRKINLIDCIED